MPSERKESQMSKSFTRMTNDIDGNTKEYVWGCELSEETKEQTWSFEDEDEDHDYLQHNLILKLAIFGKGVKEGERHIIEAETKDYEGKALTVIVANMTCGDGRPDMVSLEDLGFSGCQNAVFRLVEGSGPIHLSGQHVIDFPNDPVLSETVLEYTEDEATETEEESKKGKGAKRKGEGQAGGKKKQRGKMDSSAVSTGDDDEEDEDDEDEEEELDEEDMEDDEEMGSEEEEEDEEEEPESSPEKPKKKAKGKAKAAPAKPAPKAAKAPAKKAAGKKGKAK